MTEINDTAILKRAKELCAQDGVAWNWLTAAGGARVLDDSDRRECLMRARDELITEAIAAGTWQYGKPVQSDRVAGSDPPPANPADQVDRLKPTTNIEPTFSPKRRVG